MNYAGAVWLNPHSKVGFKCAGCNKQFAAGDPNIRVSERGDGTDWQRYHMNHKTEYPAWVVERLLADPTGLPPPPPDSAPAEALMPPPRASSAPPPVPPAARAPAASTSAADLIRTAEAFCPHCGGAVTLHVGVTTSKTTPSKE